MNLVKLFECWSYSPQWYLVEMLLDIPASEISWDKFIVPEEKTNPGDWQCPYMEQYLNNDGTARICDTYAVPQDDATTSRVAFFLYKSSGRVLRTPYGEFDLTADAEAPERLNKILSFEEID